MKNEKHVTVKNPGASDSVFSILCRFVAIIFSVFVSYVPLLVFCYYFSKTSLKLPFFRDFGGQCFFGASVHVSGNLTAVL